MVYLTEKEECLVSIQFRKKEEWFTFYDTQGNLIKRKTEIRFDPLSGESSRLVFDAGLAMTAPDYTEAAAQTSGSKCPFCPENILKMTPVFPKEIAPDGRIFQGEAILFPNLFPYSKHNGVVAFSGQHYVRLEQFTAPVIKDAFVAAQTYIQNVNGVDSEAKYASINWNYLPYSGGSILHPHMHIIISETPTNVQARIDQLAENYENKFGKDYFTALYHTEKELGERWIGERGNVAWMHAFAPKSHNDFMAIFPKAYSIHDISEQDWVDFAEGLQTVFATLSEQGLASFNLAFTVSTDKTAKRPVHVRMIPRLTIGMLGTSDMNFFQTLHQEPLTYKAPEEIATKTRAHFEK